MRRVLVGHRGVGKSSLLQRHSAYFPEVKHFDLDGEIEKRTGLNPSRFFETQGEAGFRLKEKEVFLQLIAENESFAIATGAGFNSDVIPKDIEVIFICRITDRDGRIFLNRPQLEKNLSPLDEYRKRYEERHKKFVNRSDFSYQIPEGITGPDQTESILLNKQFFIGDAYYTLQQTDLHTLKESVGRFKNIELRTDLLSGSQICEIVKTFPQQTFLVSVRNKVDFDIPANVRTDYDYLFLHEKADIVSSHSDSIQTGLRQLTEFSGQAHLKLCPLVNDFNELEKGFKWQQEDPKNRSFLPRSLGGRWQWYRLIAKYLQVLNFVKSSDVADQPSLYEWLNMPAERPLSWGAVIGYPVYFSRSPAEHAAFFKKRKSFFSRVEIPPNELETGLKFLKYLGCEYMAVTSPLKEAVFNSKAVKSERAESLKAANTVFWGSEQMQLHNTDTEGFSVLVKDIAKNAKVAIWGGGGTLQMMKSVLPDAFCFSSQTGLPRAGSVTGNGFGHEFDYLIWAAPRSHKTLFPPDSLKFKNVIDLNYTDNSMGLEFASDRKINYISGLEMFKAQAAEQQKFWAAKEELHGRK
jgi:shikimate 5-dehydrogenase/shikimate kinase